MATTRNYILKLYKNLHKVSKEVFDQDVRALKEAQTRIRLEFRKNKDLEKQEEISEKIKVRNVNFSTHILFLHELYLFR